jgi:outer membrane lipoprotein SlyB
MFGKQAASTSIASMKDLKIKGGSFDMAGAAGVAGVAIGMLGSAIGKGDGDAATFTKREKKGVLMSST